MNSLGSSLFARVRFLYKNSFRILEEGPLLLLLAGLRGEGNKESEILLCKHIRTVGEKEMVNMYEGILREKRKLSNEGWVYYAVKDAAGDRAKEAKSIAKKLQHALWEDIKAFGPSWNELYGYCFT